MRLIEKKPLWNQEYAILDFTELVCKTMNAKHSSGLTVLETRHPSTRLPNDEATVAFIDTEYDD